MKIALDAGHGGRHLGKVIGDIQEKDINIKIVAYLIEVLKSYDLLLTREADNTVSLLDRAILTKKFQPDCFISIHCNAFATPEPRGHAIYYHHIYGSEPYITKQKLSRNLATCITNTVKNRCNIPFHGIGIKDDYEVYDKTGFKVLRLLSDPQVCDNPIPAILIETLFMTNPTDIELLKSDEFLKKVASSIAYGLEIWAQVSL